MLTPIGHAFLIQNPRLTPFFQLIPDEKVAGTTGLSHFARLCLRPLPSPGATMIGCLTLAAIYALGRELLPRRAAGPGLAVLYWHVHLPIGWLMPLVGSLAMAWLRAYRTNRTAVGWAQGCVGLLVHFSARLWLGYTGLLLVYWGVREADKRRGILLAGAVTAVVALPLFLYTTFTL